VRINREYEASDIDFADPRNSVLLEVSLIAMLTQSRPDESGEDLAKRIVAAMRTVLESTGYAITKTEVPDMIRRSFE